MLICYNKNNLPYILMFSTNSNKFFVRLNHYEQCKAIFSLTNNESLKIFKV